MACICGSFPMMNVFGCLQQSPIGHWLQAKTEGLTLPIMQNNPVSNGIIINLFRGSQLTFWEQYYTHVLV